MLKVTILAVDLDRIVADVAEVVPQVLDKIVSCAVDNLVLEYRDKDGQLLTNCDVKADDLNELIHITVQPLESRFETLGCPDLPLLALRFRRLAYRGSGFILLHE